MEKVKINIVPKGLKPACYVSQNDNGRVVRFELFDELTPYTLDGSETITITVVRPDGVELVSSVVNTEDSYIDVVFNDDMTAIAGIADCELTITDGETVLGSRNFDMNIEIDAYNGKDVVIETATGVIASFNTEVEDNALEYESEIPYNAEGYTGLEIINSRTAPAYDKTPYLFRKTPSGYGNSCIEKLTGLTVAFNQLVKTTDFTSKTEGDIIGTNNGDGSYTVDGTSTGTFDCYKTYTLIAEHVYFICGCPVGGSADSYYIYCKMLRDIGNGIILKINATYTTTIDIIVKSGVTVNNLSFYPQLIDLTQMLGSTIADYLYNLETQTAGAGVSLFKSLGFDKSYYPYNAGELMSSKPTSKKVVGFNQWDEETENGYITTSGDYEYYAKAIRSKNFCSCIPNTQYYYKRPTGMEGFAVCWYDKNYNFIVRVSNIINITSPTNAYYFKLSLYNYKNFSPSYNNDICFNFSDPEKNGTYEPYSEETYNLGGDELRGLLKLDANNNIYADGDIYTSDGKNKRRYGIVDLGSLNWDYVSGANSRFIVPFNLAKGATASNVFNGICAIYTADSLNNVYSHVKDKSIAVTATYIWIYDSNYSDATIFKTAMSGVYLVYEVATPTEEESLAYDNPQEVKVTEEFIDNRAIPIPVGHDTLYGTDIEYQDIDFDTTIFGGDINAIDGVLTSRYNSDGSVKTTPDVIELDPALIPVKAGDNNIFNSASGAQTIRYYNQED